MGIDLTLSPIARIGETAGLTWQFLSARGPVNLTVLVKELGVPRDQVMQAIGWLARENKIVLVQEKRKTLISLAT